MQCERVAVYHLYTDIYIGLYTYVYKETYLDGLKRLFHRLTDFQMMHRHVHA